MDTLPNDLSALIKKYLSSDQVILLFENEDVQYCNMYDACHNRNWNSILYNLDQNRYNDSYMKVWCDESIKFNDGELRKFFEYIYYSSSKYSSYFDKRFFVKGCECNELDENIDCDCVCNCKVDCNCSCHKCECDDCHVHPHPDKLRRLGIRTKMTAMQALYQIFDLETIENNLTVFSKISDYMQRLYECVCDSDYPNINWRFYGVRDRYLKLYNIVLDHYISKYKLHNFDKSRYRNSRLDSISGSPKPPSKKDVIAFYKQSNNL